MERDGEHGVHLPGKGQSKPPPDTLRAFPRAVKKRPKSGVSGTKKRLRWQESNGTIYEWDYQHGAIEKYDKRGRYLGTYPIDVP